MWKSCCWGRQKFTFWLLLKDKLNTRNILRRKGRILDDYSCPLCASQTEERADHLFFTCYFSKWCWRFINIQWNEDLEITERIIQGRRDFHSCIYRELLLVAVWAIWKHRNEVVFDGVPVSLRRWKVIFMEELSLVCYRAKSSLKPLLSNWLCNFS